MYVCDEKVEFTKKFVFANEASSSPAKITKNARRRSFMVFFSNQITSSFETHPGGTFLGNPMEIWLSLALQGLT